VVEAKRQGNARPQNAWSNLDDLAGTLASALHINATEVISAVEQAKPTDFVPVVTLREAEYRADQAKIHELPGTVFRTGHSGTWWNARAAILSLNVCTCLDHRLPTPEHAVTPFALNDRNARGCSSRADYAR